MHISIGAAILILGLLFLATSKAGLKVLGVLFVVGVVGVGAMLYQDHLTTLANVAQHKAWVLANCNGSGAKLIGCHNEVGTSTRDSVPLLRYPLVIRFGLLPGRRRPAQNNRPG
jgi:hypothetical protein